MGVSGPGPPLTPMAPKAEGHAEPPAEPAAEQPPEPPPKRTISKPKVPALSRILPQVDLLRKLLYRDEDTSAIRPAGRRALLYNDEHYSRIRKAAGVADDFLNTGWGYNWLEHGGGKGGNNMAFLPGGYVVKELSQVDHMALLEVTESYVEHVMSGPSCLCRILLHYVDWRSGRKFFAMRNEVGNGPFKALYDLKGCHDDKTVVKAGKKIKAVHKRVWRVHMWCGKYFWSQERHAYHAGKMAAGSLKLQIEEQQRTQLVEQLAYDTDWLTSLHLMDYSLLVGIMGEEEMKAQGGLGGPATAAYGPTMRVSCEDGKDLVAVISIIDFLTRWSCKKRVARCVKCLQQNKATVPPSVYGHRFLQHFQQLFEAVGSSKPCVLGLSASTEEPVESPEAGLRQNRLRPKELEDLEDPPPSPLPYDTVSKATPELASDPGVISTTRSSPAPTSASGTPTPTGSMKTVRVPYGSEEAHTNGSSGASAEKPEMNRTRSAGMLHQRAKKASASTPGAKRKAKATPTAASNRSHRHSNDVPKASAPVQSVGDDGASLLPPAPSP